MSGSPRSIDGVLLMLGLGVCVALMLEITRAWAAIEAGIDQSALLSRGSEALPGRPPVRGAGDSIR